MQISLLYQAVTRRCMIQFGNSLIVELVFRVNSILKTLTLKILTFLCQEMHSNVLEKRKKPGSPH